MVAKDTISEVRRGGARIQGSEPQNKYKIQTWTIEEIRGYRCFRALVFQSGETSIVTTSTPSKLLHGESYTITSYTAEDDFSNLGALTNNTNATFVCNSDGFANKWTTSTLQYNEGAPVVQVLENSLIDTDGEPAKLIQVTYDNAGTYTLYFSGDIESKTLTMSGEVNSFRDFSIHSDVGPRPLQDGEPHSASNISIFTRDNSRVLADSVLENGSVIEIKAHI
jgi:hypothetical protein